ncbi:hypothetical protein [Peribacillus sp. SCS-155]|uniref:hypothetical protein n=1 Tax=Peribacillus sedimenti TaxID=3115297 RepID=UPI003905DE2F
MVKTIKFNLILDGINVRDLEVLKNNFNIDDILEYYHSGLLHKWFSVRGMDSYVEKLTEVQEENDLGIIKKIIEILNIKINPTEVEEAIYSIKYQKEQQEILDMYKESNFTINQIIDDYHQGYSKLVNQLLDQKEDIAFIKATIKEIIQNYEGLFRLNTRHFYEYFIEKAPIVIFAVLLNDQARKVFLNHKYVKEVISKIAFDAKILEQLGEHLKIFKGQTEGYWKDLEPNGKKFMVISLVNGNFVRSIGNVGEQLSSNDVNGQFVILNGLNYMSNNSTHELKYMEV